MINKLFDARSTVWQLLFALLVVAWFTHAADTAISESGSFTYTFDVIHAYILGLFVLVAVLAQVAIHAHNKKRPGQKLALWTIRPPEILNGDEMFENASSNAARKVYLYSNLALPLLVVIVLFYREFPIGVGLTFALYLTGYYLTYLRAIWPYLGND